MYDFPGVSSNEVTSLVLSIFIDLGSPEAQPLYPATLIISVPTLVTIHAQFSTTLPKPWLLSKNIQSLTHQSSGLWSIIPGMRFQSARICNRSWGEMGWRGGRKRAPGRKQGEKCCASVRASVCLLKAPWRPWTHLSYSLLWVQLLEHCLTHSKCSLNIFSGLERPDKGHLDLLRIYCLIGSVLMTLTHDFDPQYHFKCNPQTTFVR